MKNPLIVVVAALLVLVALAGCGDDDAVFEGSTTTVTPTSSTATTAAEPTTTAAVTTTAAATTTGAGGGTGLGGLVAGALAEGSGAEAPIASGDEEQCLTDGLAEGLGPERFAELDALAAGTDDITTVFADMTDPELDVLVDAVKACFDVESLLTSELASDELSPEAVACFAESLSREETLKSLIRAMITGEDPASNPEFLAVVIPIMTTDCVEPLAAMLIEEFEASGMSAEGAACVADEFLRGGLFETLLNSMLGGGDVTTDAELQAQMMTAVAGCLSPEELAELGG